MLITAGVPTLVKWSKWNVRNLFDDSLSPFDLCEKSISNKGMFGWIAMYGNKKGEEKGSNSKPFQFPIVRLMFE